MKRLIALLSLVTFLSSLMVFTSCSGSKKGQSRVHSGSGMGNSKHKNRHVWGK